MIKKGLFILCLLMACGFSHPAAAQDLKTKNVVVITFDGFRWKEFFEGADSANLFGKKFTRQDSAWRVSKYWGKDREERRARLMPFIWNTFARQGQLFGNRNAGNFVNVKNKYWFSFPGYNELFTGYPDSLINSNAHPPNHNINVLEFLNAQPDFKGKVATFTSWDAFYNILNAQRAGFPINSGYHNVEGEQLSAVQTTLNQLMWWLPKDYGMGERHDAITYLQAKEYVQKYHPRVLQLSFIETDALAHDGRYDFYLDAAHYNDAMIADLWNMMQNDPFYKDQTTFIVTEDHGRGYGDNWQHHYYSVPHSDEIFLGVMGPDTPPSGEQHGKGQLYQNQVAQTIAAFLGLKFENGHETGLPIAVVFEAKPEAASGRRGASGGNDSPGGKPAPPLLSDPQATSLTRALYKNLHALSQKQVLFGHQDDLAYGVNWKYVSGRSDIKDLTGDYPAVYGWDLAHIEHGAAVNIDSVPFNRMRQYIQEGYARGGVITLSWHFDNPLSGGSAWDTTAHTVAAILPGGPKHALFKTWLDRGAAFIKTLTGAQGEAIPILFRPFHELNGDWFWWGKNTTSAQEFKALWVFTVNYLRQEKGLHNLIMVYNTNSFGSAAEFMEKYPGDAYADVLSFDKYQFEESRADFVRSTRQELRTLTDIAAARHKLAAFAETGYEAVPDAQWWTKTLWPIIKGMPISYVLVWRNAGYMPSMKKMHYYAPYTGQVSAADFRQFYQNRAVLFGKSTARLHLYQE